MFIIKIIFKDDVTCIMTSLVKIFIYTAFDKLINAEDE